MAKSEGISTAMPDTRPSHNGANSGALGQRTFMSELRERGVR